MLSPSDFPLPFIVRGRDSVEDLYLLGSRRGIYILYFADGELYVGQTDDVTQSFVEHRKANDDIVKLSFKRVGKRRLAEAERSVIASLQHQGYVVRNQHLQQPD
jgi:hypothetical protein